MRSGSLGRKPGEVLDLVARSREAVEALGALAPDGKLHLAAQLVTKRR